MKIAIITSVGVVLSAAITTVVTVLYEKPRSPRPKKPRKREPYIIYELPC